VPKVPASPSMRSPTALETAQSFQVPAAAWPEENWWAAYGDSQIDRLMDEALARAPSLEAAVARVRAAEALVQQVPGSPSLSGHVEAKTEEARQSTNVGIPPAVLPQGWNWTAQT